MGFITVYVTFPNIEEAKNTSSQLLEKKIIACFNTFPISSSYYWLGNIENSNEIVSLLKTKKENWEILKKEIFKLHSYKIPCIMKFEVEANEEYEKWINEETKI